MLSCSSCNILKKETKSITKSPVSDIDVESATAIAPESDSTYSPHNVSIESAEPNFDIQPDKSISVGSSAGDSYSDVPPDLKIKVVTNTKIVKENSDLSEGRIVYKIPDKMKIRSTYKVLVRISKSKTVLSIYDSLSGDVRTSTLPVTESMEVKLIDISPSDKKSFEITQDNNAEQIIEEGDTYTEWSWDVTPVRVGNSKLKIIISVIRDKGKKDIVYEDTVEVEKDILVQILFFLEKYWQVLMTSMAIPFLVWIYKSRKENKEKEKEKEKEEKDKLNAKV